MRGKQEFHWELQSHLLALLANIHRDKKKRSKPYQPSEFNPLVAKKVKKRATGIIASIAAALLPEHKQATFAALNAARDRARETGDWSEFRRLAEEAKAC